MRTEYMGEAVSAANTVYERLIDEYQKNRKAIEVDFRKMVDWIPYGNRASHSIHLYPAKLLPHIPILFISNEYLSAEQDTVFDPFCGSGTVPLESLLFNRKSVAADANPLARLVTKVKTSEISADRLNSAYSNLRKRILSTAPSDNFPNVTNIDYWFHPHVKLQLNHIKESISKMRSNELKDFFNVAFSNTIKKVSLADPMVSVPVKLNSLRYSVDSEHYKRAIKAIEKIKNIDVYNKFYQMVELNIKHLNNFTELRKEYNGNDSALIYDDARKLEIDGRLQPSNSVQLIVTSPPYAGAQKYVRSASLNMGWLGYCESNVLRDFDKKTIGREHYSKGEYEVLPKTGVVDADLLLRKIAKKNVQRGYIAANYLIEMRAAFEESHRILKYGGYFVLVIGNNTVCGFEFLTSNYLRTILESLGFILELDLIDHIHSRGLMTKRNKTAGMIASESVMVFRKI
ncbi:MAG: DNA modification methylase [Arenicella sp.]|jgi:DNA modification methylase